MPEVARAEIQLSDPWDYAELAEGVEAWGFRAIQEDGEPLDRAATAAQWLEREYRPVVAMLREAELIGSGTETDAYMRVAAERYRLLRTHAWNEEVLQRLVEEEGRGRRRRSVARGVEAALQFAEREQHEDEHRAGGGHERGGG